MFNKLPILFFCLFVLKLLEGKSVGSAYKIIGGKPADKNLWKFITAVSNGQVFHCGGSLIRENWVLTAAHCVHGEVIEKRRKCFGPIRIRLGTKDLKYTRNFTNVLSPKCKVIPEKKFSLVKKEESVEVLKIYVHPHYFENKVMDHELCGNDVALLQLNTSFNETLVKLPSKPFTQVFSCMVAGWGLRMIQGRNLLVKQNELQQLTLFPLHNEECKMIYDNMASQMGSADRKHMPQIICGRADGKSMIYSGDSGGPLVCDGELYGITSLHARMSSFTGQYYMGIFSEVPCYVNWINEVFQQNGEEEFDPIIKVRNCVSGTPNNFKNKHFGTFFLLIFHILKLF